MAFATTDDGARIYYETFSGAPDVEPRRLPILMVMGFAANGRLWGPAIRRSVADGFDVITFDNRGCGRSDTPLRPYTTRAMARDAVAVLDDLGVERAHVGGASLGGMIAQELALEFPARVASLVLLSTTGGIGRLGWARPRAVAHVLDAALRSLRGGGDPERAVRDFLRMAASEQFADECRPGDEIWETVAAMLEDPGTQLGVALQLVACLRHSSWGRLSRLTMPVQIHHGTDDPLIPLAAGRELARRIPDARFELHPGAGHALFERTYDVGERIIAFLDACDACARDAPGARA